MQSEEDSVHLHLLRDVENFLVCAMSAVAQWAGLLVLMLMLMVVVEEEV